MKGKLNKRQIIILVVAGLFVLYALYDVLILQPAGKKSRTEVAQTPVTEFVSDVQKDLGQEVMAELDSYIVRRAEADWGKSPFWDRAAFREWASAGIGQTGTATPFVYSGYIDAGSRKVAIISGWEYGIGDALDIPGYVVKSIMPSRVVIFNQNSGAEISVPLQD